MVLMLSLLLLTVPQSQPENSAAAGAFAVLQKNCAGCHGDTGFAKTYLLLDRSAMVKAGKIAPGNASESRLYKRITGAVEPLMPEGGTKLTDADIATIKRWIDEGVVMCALATTATAMHATAYMPSIRTSMPLDDSRIGGRAPCESVLVVSSTRATSAADAGRSPGSLARHCAIIDARG